MKTDTSVKWFSSSMPGAPALSGVAGSAIAVLDACLVTGWGLQPVNNLVVTDNVATATITAGHAATVGSVVLVAGASPSTLNGEWRVTAATGTTVQFATEGIANQTASGSITLKLAPAGWEKAFGSGTTAVYRPTAVESSRNFLRVDDSGTTTCRAVGYETMSSADLGDGAFPTAAQQAGGLYWQKSSAASAVARPWFLASDGRLFYFGVAYNASSPTVFDIALFGEIKSVKSADVFSCAIFGVVDGSVSTPAADRQLSTSSNSLVRLYIARGSSGVGSSYQCSKAFPSLVVANNSVYYSGAVYGVPYPNPADGGLYLTPQNVLEGQGGQPAALRGSLPGMYCCPQLVAQGTFANGDVVPGTTALQGRLLRALQSYYTTPPNNQTSFIDTTGPWR